MRDFKCIMTQSSAVTHLNGAVEEEKNKRRKTEKQKNAKPHVTRKAEIVTLHTNICIWECESRSKQWKILRRPTVAAMKLSPVKHLVFPSWHSAIAIRLLKRYHTCDAYLVRQRHSTDLKLTIIYLRICMYTHIASHTQMQTAHSQRKDADERAMNKM